MDALDDLWMRNATTPTPSSGGYFPAANSIDWLQQRLPKPVADWIGRDYAQNERWMQEVGEPRKLAGETLSMGMSLLPAGRLAVPRAGGIRGYHGSPYDFPAEPGYPLGRFRNDKIGSGEGHQTYGYGH